MPNRPAPKKDHFSNEKVREALTNCPALWQHDVEGSRMTCYATRSGLVIFMDFANDAGWSMLTETPSNSIDENLYELRSMCEGTATVRQIRQGD